MEASLAGAYWAGEGDALLAAQMAEDEEEEEEQLSEVPNRCSVGSAARVGRPIRRQEEPGVREDLQTKHPIRLSQEEGVQALDPNQLGLVEELLHPICFLLEGGRVVSVLEASEQVEYPSVLGPLHGGSS